MKTTSGLPTSRQRNFLPHLALLVALALCPAALAEDKAADKPANAVTARPEPKPKLAAGFEEVVAMSEAGVSKELLVKFVESSAKVAQPTGADIIAMKARGLPDEVIVTLMARGAVQAREAQARRTVAAPAIVRQLSTDGQLDPESYEFFWYHHAYPRALASSYQTLAPYSPSYYQRGNRNRDRIPWRTDGFAGDSLVQKRPATARVSGQRR
jgi:glucose/arabinose dehydrogenase